MWKCSSCWHIHRLKTFTCQSCKEFWTVEEVIESSSKQKKSVWSLPKRYDYQSETKQFIRYSLNSQSLNDIFWWGLVKWSVSYLSAQPGAWKSTFLTWLLNFLDDKSLRMCYYSWEESESQVWNRFQRLHWKDSEILDRVDIYFWESLEELINIIEETEVDIVVLDSLQKIKSSEKDWETWSISQQKYCIDTLTFKLKELGKTGIIIWHVNKEGDLAWAKSIEHIVDQVYIIEGQDWRTDSIRLLKSLKGRFWWVDTIVVMKMTEKWFMILDPEIAFKAFIEESWSWSWSCFVPILEWNQLFLLEVQSLMNPMIYSSPKRVSIGLSPQKLDILLAVIWRVTKFKVQEQDIFVNIIWPVNRSTEWLDLWVVSCILSSITKIEVKDYLFIWQVWLLWEIRSLPRQEEIVRKLKNLWYSDDKIITREKCKSLTELLQLVFNLSTPK